MALGVLHGVTNAIRRAFASPSPSDRTALPQVSWNEAQAIDMACPNCGVTSSKPHVLHVEHSPLNRPRQAWDVVVCPDCTCRFYVPPPSADYAADEMLTRGRTELYLQQGAGLAQICRPIARIDKPRASRLLDIGCGFGFGLDFALRARHWSGLGLDPGQIAALGRDRLGVRIEQRLLAADEPGSFDVVMAAETLEHVPDPPAFLHLLTRVLEEDGVLVLTTPDAEALNPSTPPGQLAGLLSPELHVIFQTATSLRVLLEKAGFTAVEIEHDGGALVAYASRTPFQLGDDASLFRTMYLDYLEARSSDFPPADDLFWGLAGRCLLEAVNAGDRVRAGRVQALLHAGCMERFSIDLAHPALSAETATCSLARMAELMPLNLGGILYADAMLAMQLQPVSRDEALRLSAEASRRLCRAVGELAMADPMSEDLAWAADAEALLSAASADPANPGVLPRLLALPPAPGSGVRRDGVVLRIFVGLVNAGRYEQAQELYDTSPALAARPDALGADASFCRAVLALRHRCDAMAALADFRFVRASLGKLAQAVEAPLFWPSLRGEVQALRALGDEAAARAVRSGIISALAFTGASVPDDFANSHRQDEQA